MLDAFIIDELKRREVEERDDAGRPRLEIPASDDDHDHERDTDGSGRPDDQDDDKKPERGVVTIDL